MHECSRCGGRLRRIHRTFIQRFRYRAAYNCSDCQQPDFILRQYAMHMGAVCRCPQCGTYRVVRLKTRDHIDKMQSGFCNLLERIAGGDLYHCRYCRLQFYDRRPLSERPAKPRAADAEQPAPAPLDLK